MKRIAALSHDSLGNYVVLTPVMRMLRETYPKASLEYVGGVRTESLWRAESTWDAVYRYEDAPANVYDLVLSTERDSYAIKVAERIVAPRGHIVGSGAPDATGLAADPDWTDPELRSRYPELETGFIAEIHARCAGLTGSVPGYELARAEAPAHGCRVLVSCSASTEDKLWPVENWLSALEGIPDVGVVGVKPKPGAPAYRGQDEEESLVRSGVAKDLRGEYTLPQLVSAVEEASLVLTIDNGIMHLAAATRTPIVALFREGIHRLWTPPHAHVTVLTPAPGALVATIPVQEVREAARFG